MALSRVALGMLQMMFSLMKMPLQFLEQASLHFAYSKRTILDFPIALLTSSRILDHSLHIWWSISLGVDLELPTPLY